MKLIAPQLDVLLRHAREFIDRLDVPPGDEYVAAAAAAYRDLRSACASSWRLAYISFRPLVILLGILGHFLSVVLRVIARHSVAHGWIAAREGYHQLRTAAIWFVGFQRELPASAKYAELGALAVAAVLWLLRRHVRKHRYAERAADWYGGKKRRALRKYNDFVDRVAKTSSFLAMILPHCLYAAMVVGMKVMLPSGLKYLATRTYLCAVLSFWHPLYLTFSALGRLSPHLRDYRESKESDEKENEASGKDKFKAMTPSKLKVQRQRETEMVGLRAAVVDLLKYWVVYAILLAMVRTGKLLPFVGHVLNATADDKPTSRPRFFAKKSAGLYAKLRLPQRLVEEMTLVFFVWLRLMPSPPAVGEEGKAKIASRSRDIDKQMPVDILYGKLSPMVLSAMNSSAFLTKKAMGKPGGDEFTLLSMVIQKLKSVLDLFVLVRLISKRTREWIITTIVESSALLPAASTLLMPGYFTGYGVIYVSLVVPAGYSISSCDAVRQSGPRLEAVMPKIYDSSRYLQFWIVHAVLSSLLASFAPLLAWMPLSTHATWLLWAYIQRESTTRGIFGWFENELGKETLEDTAVMRSMRRVVAALPSNVEDTANGPVEKSTEGDDASPAPPREKNKVE